MNDSFGGAYMVYVFIGFVIIFITLISLIISYSGAFDVKNEIVSILEESEMDIETSNITERINNYIESSSYRVNIEDYKNETGLICNNNNGYCYKKHETLRGVYYTVYTFVDWEFPFFGLHGYWELKGETKILGTGKDISEE